MATYANPFQQFFGTKAGANTLTALGASLLSGRPGVGVSEGIQADTAYATQQKADADRQAQINGTAKWARTQFPELANAPDELVAQMAPALWQKQFMGGDTDPTSTYEGRLKIGQEQGLAGTDLTTYALTGNLPTGRGAAGEMALTPTWLWDEQNQRYVPGQMDKSGKVNVTAVPDGYIPADPFQMAGGKAGAQVDAKTAAAARAALPGAQQAMAIAKNAIDIIRNDQAGLNEQFGNTWGVPNRNLPTIPGVFQQSKGNWQANFAQAKGQAFMQAREMLKGGGPITDYEGMKGEAAFSRMEQAVAIGDQATFLRALDDFEAAVADGYAKLVATANGEYSEGAPGVPQSAGGANTTSTGVSWSVTQ